MNDRIHAEEWRHLQELMAEADLFAKHSLQNDGKVQPTLFMHGEHGKAMFAPAEMSSEQEKNAFAAMARLACIAHGADATVFVSEAWTRFAKPGQKLDMTKPPSQCADRQEVVVMMGQTRNSCQQRMLPMERDRKGRFIGFGQEHKIHPDRMEGRFANLMPDSYPNAQSKEMAIEALARLGVMVKKRQSYRQPQEAKENEKYNVISPDGLPITDEPFKSRQEALAYIQKWCDSFKSQGYYAGVEERIPLDELPSRLEIVAERDAPELSEGQDRDREEELEREE